MSLSARQLATELGVSHTAVNKAAARGRITRGTDGLFDLATARVEWEANVNPHQQRRGLAACPPQIVGAVQPEVPPQAPADAGPPAGPLWEQASLESGKTATTVSVELERSKVK